MIIPGYTIIRELATGGMATVYLARQDRLEREVALKVLEPATGQDQTFTARFIKESRIIARLQHSQIVTIYDFDTHGPYHYFSMEYLPGGTLTERIRFGLDPGQAVEILRRIAEALAYAHDRDVIHRDIKPQNILFRDDDTPVLTDFGIARAANADADVTQLTQVDVIIGSPKYMSPEQIMGRPLDHRSDLYSLGIVFYEMLTGQVPFSNHDVVGLAMMHCSEPIPRLPGELRHLQKILDRLTAKEPNDRFPNAHLLTAAIDGLTVTARKGFARTVERNRAGAQKPGAGGRAAAATTGRRWPLWLGAAAIAALAAAAGYWVLDWSGMRPAPVPDIVAGLPPAPPDRSGAAANYESLAIQDAEQGNLDRSLELIGLGLDANPGDARLLALRGRVTDRRTAREHQRRAQALADQGDLEAALAAVEQGLSEVPADADLNSLQATLSQRLQAERAKQAKELLAAAKTLLDAGSYQQSLDKAEAGLSIQPNDGGLRSLRDAARAALSRQKKIDALVREARDKQDQGALADGLKLVQQGLALDAGNAELLKLKQALSAAAAQRRNRAVAEVQRRARAKMDQEDFEAALSIVDQGLHDLGGDEGLQALRERIADRRTAREHLRRAQALADQGQLQAALATLGEGLEKVPADADLKAVQATLTRKLEAQQTQRAGDLLAEAKRLFTARSYQQSLDKARAGLAVQPDDSELRSLRDNAQAALQREKKIAPLLRQARDELDQGALADGLALVQQGLAIDAEDPDLLALKQALSVAVEQHRQAVADVGGKARAKLEQNDPKAALAIVDQGLQDIGDDDGLKALRDDIQRELKRQKQVAHLTARAETLREQGQLDASKAIVDQALALAPIDPDVVHLRDLLAKDIARRKHIAELVAGCRSRLPDGDEPPPDAAAAIECWQQVQDTEPDNADAGDALARIARLLPGWITTALEQQQIEQARALLDQLRRLAPDHDRLAALGDAVDVAARRLTLAPAMIRIAAGCYRMGTPDTAAEREDDERPHEVCLKAFELGRNEVTVGDFRRFVDATGYRTDAERQAGGQAGCWSLSRRNHLERGWDQIAGADWRRPMADGDAPDADPVTCVSWNDARAYIDWLKEQTRQNYRLPTEAEWEYAARAGSDTARPWGDGAGPTVCEHANVADTGHAWADGFACDDGQEWAAAVGSYPPNSWGLHDMLGNVWEWTCSVYDPGYGGAETRCDPPANDAPRTLRGGSWYSGPATVRSAYRDRAYPELRYSFLGFRLVRDSSQKASTPQ